MSIHAILANKQLELTTFLRNNRIPFTHERQIWSEAHEADVEWNASRFWATVIHRSTHSSYSITVEQFETFKLAYQLQNGVTIDADSLYNKFWLRRILGFIEIPAGMRHMHST